MKIKAKFFLTFKELFNEDKAEIELKEGSNLHDLLDLLCGTDKTRRDGIFEQSGELRSTVNILKNGQHIGFLGGLQTVLKDEDSIAIFPPMAGG